MTELEIPPKADESKAKDLVREFVDVGDEVEIWDDEVTHTDASDPTRTGGKVTGFEHGHLELDGEPLTGKSVRYDEIHTMKRVRSGAGQ